MPTVSEGQTASVRCSLPGQVTVTPVRQARVSIVSIDPEFTTSLIDAETVFDVQAGDIVNVTALGADAAYSGTVRIESPDGGIYALSEAVSVVTLTATGTAFTGACEFRGFVVRAETGGTADVTIYDATSATGTPIMTVSNIGLGTYYWDGDHATVGVGNGGRRVNSTGCHVVIAGTCTIDVMVE